MKRLMTTVVIACCVALPLASCAGKTTIATGRAVSVLYNPADAGGLPVTEGPSGPKPNAPQPTGTVENTDNGDIDHLVLLGLNDIEDFWQHNWPDAAKKPFKAVNTFVSYDSNDPRKLLICDGRAELKPEPNAMYVPPCNLVLWDRGQLIPLAKKYFGDMAVVGVFAHEFGHAIQTNAGLVAPRTPAIVKEQQADCFAGVYMRWVAEGHSSRFTLSTGKALSYVIAGVLKGADPVLTEEELEQTGDPHGTGLDRVSAFQMGFDSGSGTCAKIDVNEIKKRRGDEPITLQNTSDDPDDPNRGNVSIDEDNLSVLMEILNKVFPLKSPPKLSFSSDSCSDAKSTKGASYCPATNTIIADLPTLQDLGKPGGAGGAMDKEMLQGDNTSFSIVVSRYVLAVQRERGLPLDAPMTGVRTACLTGAAQRHMAEPIEVPSKKKLVLTGGDLDKALIGLFRNTVAASDVNGEHIPSGFTAAMAFRGGVLNNIDECFNRIG
jgi:predicted metalloprotease